MTANEIQDIKIVARQITDDIARSVKRQRAEDGLRRAGTPERYWH